MLGERAIPQLNDTKYLGLIIDQHLTCDKHVASLKTKLSSVLSLLSNPLKTVDVLKTLYFAHTHSHLSFRIVTYGAINYTDCMVFLEYEKTMFLCSMILHDECKSPRLFENICERVRYISYVYY